MIVRSSLRRRLSSALFILLAAGLSACDALLVDPDSPPLDLALTLTTASAGGAAEAFDKVDRIHVRLRAGLEIIHEVDLPFDATGGDVSVPVRAPATVDGQAVDIQVELSSDGAVVFTGTGTVLPDASGSNSAVIDLRPVAASVVIDPPSALFEAFGERLTFRAVALFATGDTIFDAEITFRAIPEGVVDVRGDGLATARAEGTASVEATYGGATAQAEARVQQRVTEIEVASVPTSLAAGASFALDPTLRDANGFEVVGRSVQWTSSDPTVLVIDPDNVARAVGSGTVTVTGTVDDATVTFTLVVAVIPVTPSNLSAKASGTVVSLTWQDNANDETSYQVLRRIAGSGSYAVVATLNANATSYSGDTGMPDTRFDYVVRACNGPSCSPESAPATVPTVPAAPSNAMAMLDSNYSVIVTWDDTNTETTFILERDDFWDGGWYEASRNSADDTQVAFDYYDYDATMAGFRVFACNQAGCSPPTPAFSCNCGESGGNSPPTPIRRSGVIR